VGLSTIAGEGLAWRRGEFEAIINPLAPQSDPIARQACALPPKPVALVFFRHDGTYRSDVVSDGSRPR
jgi:hypothetical protein